MNGIAKLWGRLENWGEKNAPEMLSDLNPAAAERQLGPLEDIIGQRLPGPLRESLLIHDGEDDGWPCKAFADYGAYLSCARIAEEWRQRVAIARKEQKRQPKPDGSSVGVEGPVRPVLFDPAWIPFLDRNGDTFWAIDFAPAKGGRPGQVIEVDWEGTYQTVVAMSFEQFFGDYVDALEAGEFTVVGGQPTREADDPEHDRKAKAQADRHLVTLDARRSVFEQSPTKRDINRQRAGAETDVIGYRTGVVEGSKCELAVPGGVIKLCGSLKGSNFNQLLRVRIRVARRRALGLLSGHHDIVSWELVDTD